MIRSVHVGRLLPPGFGVKNGEQGVAFNGGDDSSLSMIHSQARFRCLSG